MDSWGPDGHAGSRHLPGSGGRLPPAGDVWPEETGLDLFGNHAAYPLGVALATALFGIATFLYTRFTFVLDVVVGSVLVAVQFFVTTFGDSSARDRATAAVVAGAVVVAVGVLLDAVGATA